MLKKIGLMGILLLAVCALAGCGKQEEQDNTEKAEYRMYYLSPTEEALVEDDYVPEERVTASMVSEMAKKLTEPVDSDDYVKLLPDDVKILEYEFDGRGVVLNFNDAYAKMKNTREILVRAGIVKSFTQIPGVINVTFLMGGEPLTDTNGNPYCTMDKETFVENEGENPNSYVYADVNLYFANETGDKLVKVTNGGGYYSINVPLEKKIVELLIKGPPGDSDAKPTIAKDTKILGVSIVEGVCYVNLDKTFMNQSMNVQQELPVYSIVNSLMDACKIHGVQISVEGETKVTFRESMSLDKLYKADYSLVEDASDE